MAEQPESPAEEIRRLRRCINDLVGVLALPAIWTGLEPSQIIHTLLDAVVRALSLEFAYARLSEASSPTPVETLLVSENARISLRSEELRHLLGTSFAARSRGSAAQGAGHLGIEGISTFPLSLGVQEEIGLFVVGSARAGFPSKTESLLLSVAASQASLGLQEARLLSEQKRINDELDRRVAERTAQLTAANEELHKARAALQEAFDEIRKSEARLAHVIDTIPTLAWTTLPDGLNEFLSKRWQEYTGLPIDESRSWGWQAAYHPDDLPRLMNKWRQMLATGEPGEWEARLRRHDGVYRWFLIRASPFRDETGAIVRWYGISTDIDDRKRAEDELRNTQTELGRVMRAMTMGQLTASIAHEVNQPLSGIVTNASTCLRMLDVNPPNLEGARETARRTIRDGNRASEVIARLRTLYSKTEPDLEPMDLNEATREVIALSLSELQRNRVVLRQELAEGLPLVLADRIQIQQVILNLVRNGSDAMSAVDDRPRELLIKTECDEGSEVRLSVKDTGVGFDTHSEEKLFEAFYTTKDDGMGIGLSVSRSIMESHRGRLWAVRNEGPGAMFLFSIPCSAKAYGIRAGAGKE